ARSTAIGYFPEDDGGVLAASAPDRLYRIRAASWIWATGGYPVNLPVPDNDRPGVLAARAVGRLLIDHGILGGDKVCIVEVPEVSADATALASALYEAGAEVVRIALANATGTRGRSWVSALDTPSGKIECDLVAVAGIPAPASEGPRQQGCRVVLDPPAGGFRVVVDEQGRTSTPGVWACGDVTGYVGPTEAAAHGARVGMNVAMATVAVDW
ncbi:MAG TPA: FAD-dependent oxidoreductase, partial [Kofleriaceae bacterium]